MQKTFEDCKKINVLPFDFSIYKDKSKENLLGLIEYDGEQHFHEVTIFGSLDRIKENDLIKTNYCKEKNIPLLRISYLEQNNIENMITTFLKDSNYYNKKNKLLIER
ncbi:MAG: hypothetical protein PF569_10330 [Candidatus Woesearchaeota archaeon]|jgi:hypothetical protein|nr:hypothetical protein [Candidatus Woesearchaeota archaeon]